MKNSVDAYLAALKQELSGSDTATIQDALSDAEEYLRNALENVQSTQPDLSVDDALAGIIEQFGSPDEIAAAYRQIEAHVPAGLSSPTRARPDRPFLSSFFGVLVDPSAWGAVLYMLLSLVTGVIYFSWAVTGLSMSVGLIILIIGLPFLGVFLLSARGIALVEGRIVEALLGVRMPRRAVFVDKNMSWWNRFKALLFSKHTWMSILYMLLMLPLGVIYFCFFITFFAIDFSLIAAPFVQYYIDYPMIIIGNTRYFIPFEWSPVLVIGGLLGVILTMHLARLVGRAHGSLAKAMLVG